MKQKDIALILISVSVAGVISFFVCNAFLFTSADRQQSAEVVEPITSQFDLPDKTVFNSEAVNPTKLIEIGPNTNNQPFANQ
jgi:hypothetical protein